MKIQITTPQQLDHLKADIADKPKFALTHLGGYKWLFTTALEAIILQVEEEK